MILKRIRKDFERAVKSCGTCWYEEPYSNLLRKILMTCRVKLFNQNKNLNKFFFFEACDLAAVTKPWETHKRVVDLVTKEFFAQGDRERIELNKEPNVNF